eukprot:12900979-Prorocentrum_lima.AAC.1
MNFHVILIAASMAGKRGWPSRPMAKSTDLVFLAIVIGNIELIRLKSLLKMRLIGLHLVSTCREDSPRAPQILHTSFCMWKRFRRPMPRLPWEVKVWEPGVPVTYTVRVVPHRGGAEDDLL